MSDLLFEVRQLAHLAEPDACLRELVLELEDLDLLHLLAITLASFVG